MTSDLAVMFSHVRLTTFGWVIHYFWARSLVPLK